MEIINVILLIVMFIDIVITSNKKRKLEDSVHNMTIKIVEQNDLLVQKIKLLKKKIELLEKENN
ncbi:MAG: hypothetical protein IJ272_00750 [Clostridia bacterium]|nr:hypothetical protein [Clostridia bacterium]